ncbi:MAG TPA: type I polyketide synthase, partial [Myxococcota bacterium]|nr:type I polyketide synthase [Myxococcota bacterium]
ALADAGVPARALRGADAAVYVSVSHHEYATLHGTELERWDGYAGLGTVPAVASGRLSYLLGARGPSLTVDTACSSSLVATHLAVQSLRRGEASLAIAGGATLMLTPASHVEFSRARGLAADGRCKTFDAAADGTSWSEGCAVVLLERLSDAVRNGRRIHAVLRGTAVNQDGRSNGLTAPNGPAQEAVIRQALADAGRTPADVTYVEAHGTGTALGDPIELGALAAAYGPGREAPLRVGALKSNLGHTQAAAGLAGVLKVAAAMAREALPPSLHVTTPTPRFDWASHPLALLSAASPWPRAEQLAGVSAFGFSGTNAHVILEAPPATEPLPDPQPPFALPLSARSRDALRDLAATVARALRERPLADVLATLARRDHAEHRAVAFGDSARQLADALDDFDHLLHDAPAERPALVFLFPGQGGQWPGMARELLDLPRFRDALRDADRALVQLGVPSPLDALRDARLPDDIAALQPTLFALSWALAETLRHLGLPPDLVLGHSLGEVAAAAVAGALELPDAARVIATRSLLLRSIAGEGAMAAVELDREQALQRLAAHPGLDLAVHNGPRACVLAGDPDALERLLAQLHHEGVFARRVHVSVASHSPQVDPLLPLLRDRLRDLQPTQPRRAPMRSTVRSAPVDFPLDADYWCDNLRKPVELHDALLHAATRPAVFVELGPHPVLLPAVDDLRDPNARPLPALRRDVHARAALLDLVGRLFVLGFDPDWTALLPPGHVTHIGPFPWRRERHWIDAARTVRRAGGPLGAQIPVPLPGVTLWERPAEGAHSVTP